MQRGDNGLIKIEGTITQSINLELFPKKKMVFHGKEAEGIPIVDIVGEHSIMVIGKDGYSARFKKDEIKTLLLSRNRILSPHEGLSIRDVEKIIVEEERNPIVIVDDFRNFQMQMKILFENTAGEYPLIPFLPPSFSYITVYSHDGYHSSFSFEETRNLLMDKNKTVFAPKMSKARRVRNISRIEVY
jgi:hypothetical protein